MEKEIVGRRLRMLREQTKLSQAKFAEKLGDLKQPLYARYELGSLMPSYPLLVRIADYYDVSTDYLLGRTDNPHGKYYPALPLSKEQRMDEFVEMCFDPTTKANAKLKELLKKMLSDAGEIK